MPADPTSEWQRDVLKTSAEQPLNESLNGFLETALGYEPGERFNFFNCWERTISWLYLLSHYYHLTELINTYRDLRA